jgi:hypothetical protein
MRWIIATCAALVANVLAFSAPGQINPAFVGGGVAVLPVPQAEFSLSERIVSTTLDDGGLLFAYECVAQNVRICVVRLNANGSLNTTFGSAGVKTFASTGAPSRPVLLYKWNTSFVLLMHCQPGGATLNYSPCSYRFDASGVVNTTLGVNGLLVSPYRGTTESTTFTATQRFDGDIAIHYACFDKLCVERLSPAGNPNASWAGQGFVSHTLSHGGVTYRVSLSGAIVARPDGSTDHFVRCFGSQASRCAIKVADGGGVIGSELNVNPKLSIIHSARTLANGEAVLAQICEVVSLVIDPRPHSYTACLSRVGEDLIELPLSKWHADRNSFESLPATTTSPEGRFFSALEVGRDGKVYHAYQCAESPYDRVSSLCVSRRHADGALDDHYGDAGTTMLKPLQLGLTAGQRRIYVFGGFSVSESGVVWAIVLSQVVTCTSGGLCEWALPEDVRAIQLLDGPNDHRACTPDIEGDGLKSSSSDATLVARAAFGFRGSSVLQGLSFESHATRQSWPAIRDHLSNHCRVRVSP